jgi:hypothetical protein
MSDDLEVKDLIAHLYIAADQNRPQSFSINGSDPAEVGRTLDYLVQHAWATEGALRKIGQLMDELRLAQKPAGKSAAKADKDAPALKPPAPRAPQ